MIVIKSLADLKRLRADDTWPIVCLDYLESYLQSLYEAYGDGEPLSSFALGSECSLSLLEEGDEVITEVLEALPFGPESVEQIQLPGHVLWQVTVMTDNDAFEIYFSRFEALGAEFEAWLTKHCQEPDFYS